MPLPVPMGRDLGKSLELMIYLRLKQTNENVYYWTELHQEN